MMCITQLCRTYIYLSSSLLLAFIVCGFTQDDSLDEGDALTGAFVEQKETDEHRATRFELLQAHKHTHTHTPTMVAQSDHLSASAFETCVTEVEREISDQGVFFAACHAGGQQCGSALNEKTQVQRYNQVASLFARNHSHVQVCETGVFQGGSAALWLCSDARVKIVAFDLYVEPAVEKVLLRRFPGRVTLVNESSVTAIPAFRMAHEDKKCHIVSIDGGHFGYVPLHDLYNFGLMAAPEDHILFMDEVGFLEKGPNVTLTDLGEPQIKNKKNGDDERACCPDMTLAWSYGVHTGLIKEQICQKPIKERGWCEGSYLNLSAPGWESIFGSHQVKT